MHCNVCTAPAWGSSFVGGGFKKYLLRWPLPQCRSVKPAAFSTVTKVGHLATTARDIRARRTPAVCRLRRHTLRWNAHLMQGMTSVPACPWKPWTRPSPSSERKAEVSADLGGCCPHLRHPYRPSVVAAGSDIQGSIIASIKAAAECSDPGPSKQ